MEDYLALSSSDSSPATWTPPLVVFPPSPSGLQHRHKRFGNAMGSAQHVPRKQRTNTRHRWLEDSYYGGIHQRIKFSKSDSTIRSETHTAAKSLSCGSTKSKMPRRWSTGSSSSIHVIGLYYNSRRAAQPADHKSAKPDTPPRNRPRIGIARPKTADQYCDWYLNFARTNCRRSGSQNYIEAFPTLWKKAKQVVFGLAQSRRSVWTIAKGGWRSGIIWTESKIHWLKNKVQPKIDKIWPPHSLILRPTMGKGLFCD